MPADSSAATDQPLRVHYLRLAAPERWVLHGAVLGLGMIAAFALPIAGALLLAAATRLLRSPVAQFVADFLGAIGIVSGLIAPVVWVVCLGRRLHYRANRDRPGRLPRLERIFARFWSAERMPHRRLELWMRKHALGPRHITGEWSGDAFAGRVVVLNRVGPRAAAGLRAPVPFEPIVLPDDRGRLRALSGLTGEAEASLSTEPACDRMTWRGVRATVREHTNRFILLLLVLLFGLMIGDKFCRGWPRGKWGAIFGCAALFPSLYWLSRSVASYSVSWLAPGALIMAHRSILSTRQRFDVFIPESTALLVDDQAGAGYILDHPAPHRFRFEPGLGMAVVAGWLNTAHRPTVEELETFLGVEDHDLDEPPTSPIRYRGSGLMEYVVRAGRRRDDAS